MKKRALVLMVIMTLSFSSVGVADGGMWFCLQRHAEGGGPGYCSLREDGNGRQCLSIPPGYGCTGNEFIWVIERK
ncbi:hypothetical protein [Roseivirga sp.]|uniref:hypothetical protein n=1 Tax=Roseivirga sp. TaxID=1964215 RepID=UPI003B528F01